MAPGSPTAAREPDFAHYRRIVFAVLTLAEERCALQVLGLASTNVGGIFDPDPAMDTQDASHDASALYDLPSSSCWRWPLPFSSDPTALSKQLSGLFVRWHHRAALAAGGRGQPVLQDDLRLGSSRSHRDRQRDVHVLD